MKKIIVWSNKEASEELQKRLKQAKETRKLFEERWRDNERAVFERDLGDLDDLSLLDENAYTDSEIKMNYILKYVRFLHAQMSANPPSAIPKPTSQDLRDQRSASAADAIIQHGIREEEAQDSVDIACLSTLIYGTSWPSVRFNKDLGEVLVDIDMESGEVETSGEIDIKDYGIFDVWIDPVAKRWKDCRYVFIRHKVPLDEAHYKWPEFKDKLQPKKSSLFAGSFFNDEEKTSTAIDSIEVFEYIEKGLPQNGMVGRNCFMLEDGTILDSVEKNPYPSRGFPIHPFTDIDVPGRIYGESVVTFLARGQEILTAIDSTILDNLQAHTVVRLVLPDGAKIKDESISNDGWSVIETAGGAGGGAPYFMSPPQIMPDVHTFRNNLLIWMAEIAGVNESMTGNQSREMSGFSMQTAINAGNLTRRRLFNKYAKTVKWIWTTYLKLVAEHWSDERKLSVVGDDGTLEVASFSSKSIEGGYDLQVDYGESFSLDPASRREEIMQLIAILKEAGMTPQQILSKMKLNDVKGLIDIADLAQKRQEEIFEEMIAKEDLGALTYIPPRELEDHKAMLSFAYKFVMTKKYKSLPDDVKNLIDRHIKEREQLGADPATAPAMPEAGGVPGMPPMPTGGPDLSALLGG